MRKAVSPLLATIILIAITIAIGALVYQLVYSSVGAAGQVAQVQITSASIIQPTSGKSHSSGRAVGFKYEVILGWMMSFERPFVDCSECEGTGLLYTRSGRARLCRVCDGTGRASPFKRIPRRPFPDLPLMKPRRLERPSQTPNARSRKSLAV